MFKKFLIFTASLVALFSCVNGVESNKGKTTESMKTIELTKGDFLEKVMNYETNPNEWKFLGDKPAIVDFYASWCGPCKMVAPILEELAKEYEGKIDIYKVNTEKEMELSTTFGIRSIPSILFIPKEGEPHMIQGAMSKIDFVKVIDKIIYNKQ
jgi:thioredoxin 1